MSVLHDKMFYTYCLIIIELLSKVAPKSIELDDWTK